MVRRIISIVIPVMVFSSANGQVKVIAHRGASFDAPENTIAAAKLAWRYKADAVECDIYLSKDNRIICSHDATTKRTTGKDLRINATESSILRTLDAGIYKNEKFKGQKLPYLHELIRTVPRGKELVVEIKCGTEVLPFLRKSVENFRKNRIYSFICFDLNTIAETKKIFPEDCCYWLCSKPDQLETEFRNVAEAGLEGVSLHYSVINEDVMRRAADLNLEVYSWTVDDPTEARRLISLGVKGITSNKPDLIREKISDGPK